MKEECTRYLPIAPEISSDLNSLVDLQSASEEALEKHIDIGHHRFADHGMKGVAGNVLEFTGCVFERCRFQEADVKRMSFVDCFFDHCDMSNMRFLNTTFQRTHFKNCRMIGADFSETTMMNTNFEACAMDYAGFTHTKIKQTQWTTCCLRESLWTEVNFQHIFLIDSDFTGSEWQQTPLKGLDFTACKIEGIRIAPQALAGLKVTMSQAVELSRLLGIVIDGA